MKFGVGQPITRKEDERFLKGTGRYTGDIVLPNQAYAVFVRSPHAHAHVRRLDTRHAERAPGVIAVFTGRDVEAAGLGQLCCHYLGLLGRAGGGEKLAHVPARPLLARERVRHLGDGVAMIVAATPAQARDAAELVAADYDVRPAVAGVREAARPGATAVWDDVPDNVCFAWENGDRQATDAAFASAHAVVAIELINNRVAGVSLEPRAAIGAYDPASGRLTLYASTQGAHVVRNTLAEDVFRIPADRIRVLTPDVGGEFGLKLHTYVEYALVLWAAQKIGRPVKWVSDRAEAFISDTHGRDNVSRAELAFDPSGRALALRVETLANMGAYISSAAPIVPTYACRGIQLGVYAIPVAHVLVKGVYTHTVPVDAYRGAGRPEAIYLIERLMDRAARELGIDPVELRRRNFIAPARMPYATPLGLTYDSGDFATVLERTIALADWKNVAARRAETRGRGKLRGVGIAYYIEKSGDPAIGPEAAVIRFDQDDVVRVAIGTQATGQGHETAFAQLLAERLGVPFAKVVVDQGDTDLLPAGGGSGGSRTLMVGGSALALAADDVIRRARAAAADHLEVAVSDVVFADGAFAVAGTDRRLRLFEVAAAFRKSGAGEGLWGRGDFNPPAPTFPNGCHICEIELDPETGAYAVVAYAVVDDFGRIINPLLVEGQVHGGIAQGIGQAMIEEARYDAAGQLLTGSLMDYALPRAFDLPAPAVRWHEVLTPNNPLGVKGAGKSGAIGAPPALVNALLDALRDHGVDHIDMPATPDRIWRAMASASARR